MANLVEYVKTVWENGKTALNAARINNIENGISNCATQINSLGDSVSLCTTIDGNTIEKINFQVYTTGNTNYFQAVIYLPGEEPIAVNLHIWES